MPVVELNRQKDLYLVHQGRIIFIPKGWCDDFKDWDEGEEPSIYCWIGQESVSNWLTNQYHEWFTTDAQGWMPISDLETMPSVTQSEARRIDPDLFRLLDGVNSGEAK
jgi:hypothetical protein